jgi:hypothetical protein
LPRSRRVATPTGNEGTLGRAGAAKQPSPLDNQGHERTPNPQVGPAARWSLDRPNLAYNDEVIHQLPRALQALANEAGGRRGRPHPAHELVAIAARRESVSCSPAMPTACP